MLQQFLRTATDGWELALTSVRDLFAEADLHADEVGGDFAGEAARLGATLPRSTQTSPSTSPATRPATPRQADLATDGMRGRLDAASASYPSWRRTRPARAASTTRRDGRAGGRYSGSTATSTSARPCARSRGGRSSTSRASRPSRSTSGCCPTPRCATSPACCGPSTTPPATCWRRRPTGPTQLRYRADEWAERNRDAFLDGYAEARGSRSRELTPCSRAYETDKAVYEAVYEARNRPTWVAIPIAIPLAAAE